MTDQQLRTFITVVESGSFGKAESKLHITRPGIKKQMDTLEEELGFSLLSRYNGGVELTPAGQEFFSGIKNIITALDKVTDSSRSIATHSQSIRIYTPDHPRQLLMDACIEFTKLHPDIQLHLEPYSDKSHLVDDLLQGKTDLIECTFHAEYLKPSVCSRLLVSQTYRCVVSPSHPLAVKSSLNPADLAGYTVAIGGLSPASFIQEISSYCTNPPVEIMSKNNLSDIYNLCYNNGIFISKATFIDSMQPFVVIPLKTEHIFYSTLLYLEPPRANIKEFLKVVDQLFPLPEIQK